MCHISLFWVCASLVSNFHTQSGGSFSDHRHGSGYNHILCLHCVDLPDLCCESELCFFMSSLFVLIPLIANLSSMTYSLEHILQLLCHIVSYFSILHYVAIQYVFKLTFYQKNRRKNVRFLHGYRNILFNEFLTIIMLQLRVYIFFCMYFVFTQQ